MSNTIIFSLLLVLVGGVSGLCIGYIMQYFETKKRYKELKKKYPSLDDVTETNICKESPHDWREIMLHAMVVIPDGKYMVCTTCGFVCGTNYKLNDIGLQAVSQGLQRERAKTKYYDDYRFLRQKKLDETMNQLIKLEIEKLNDNIQNNIEVLQQFFRKSVIEIDSITLETDKELKEGKNGEDATSNNLIRRS